MREFGELTVREFMTPQVTVVVAASRLVDAIRLMDDHGISAVPVVDAQGSLDGILSSSDLLEIVHEFQTDLDTLQHVQEETREFLIKVLMYQGDNTLVCDVMTSPVETISADTNLISAAQKLNDRKFHHLPVVDADKQAIGIISSSDFVRAIAENGTLATSQSACGLL